MNIIIVGDGKVGNAIARQLSRESHDVTVIENKAEVLENTLNSMDVVGVIGNGASPAVLQEANVDQADLVIAATSTDEINIITCLIARKMGARNTIARIRTPEYAQGSAIIQDELSLSLQINPELAAAQEIRRSLRFVSSIKVTSLAKGRMELAEIKVTDDSPMIGKSVARIKSQYKSEVLFCCIRRDEDIIIPTGSTIIRAGDKISFTGRTRQLQEFFIDLRVFKPKQIRDVMIVGGARIAYYLTPMLLELGMQVNIIEKDLERCLYLLEQFPEANVINGDGTDHDFLLSESLAEMDAFVALTDNDEENVIVSMFAKSLGINHVLPKVNRVPLSFLLEKLGLENAITPKNITANQIVQYVRAMQNSVGSNVESLVKILNDEVEVLEFRIKPSCSFLNTPIRDVAFKSGLMLAYVIRKGIPQIVNGNTKIQDGDVVIVISKIKGLSDINDILL